jgi:serine/threonine-protein phosphatase 4 regulatory subunit 2
MTLLEIPEIENSEAVVLPVVIPDQNHIDENNNNSHNHDNGEIESDQEFAEEEVRSTLELIASTGKFWLEWANLKSMLSFHLKRVVSAYPEASLPSDEQNSVLGEAYSDLVKRLNNALRRFVDGPPFTLQRLCEILLEAQSIYPNLSKLGLALEKILLVTSTLDICTEPYPSALTVEKVEEMEEIHEVHLQSGPLENGVDPTVTNNDETTTDAGAGAETEVDMAIDENNFQEIVNSDAT